MTQRFVLFGGTGRKIILENATHPCPRCNRANTVQLTRHVNELIVFNKRFGLPNNMSVRYECNRCKWKNQSLPESDPSNQLVPSNNEDVDYFSSINYLFVGSKTLTNPSESPSFSSSSDLTTKPHSTWLDRPFIRNSSWQQRSLFQKRASCC